MTYLRSIFLMMLFFLTGTLLGQVDTTETVIPVKKDTSVKKDTLKFHSPKKAALLSLIPGGGQIYNKKWWKLPIIYTGLGIAGYFAIANGAKAREYSNEYFFRLHEAEKYYKLDPEKYSISNILSQKSYYLRNMEISIGVFTILYVLNIIDALVDAHLFYFDVSDDLSFRIAPYIDNNPLFKTLSAGVTFSLSLR